ncbi:ABC transporter ATP-binding protein [Streptomyces sp. NPDC058461]|uniref:ABC transporter ATP-binding protein n=1 Tax=Streptomyces sp. NPDC058461 TaxID=3346509 RepID=UPI00364F04F2
MTAPTTSSPTEDDERPDPTSAPDTGGTGPDTGTGADRGDPFDRDVLPAPPGATGRLLRSLLAPMRARVVLTTVLLLLQQAAVQAGPLLVAYAIDRAVPAFRADDLGPLIVVAAGYLGCALAAGGLQYGFLIAAARVNQDVLLDLRGRIFRHAQALSVDFHDRYTSGRLISRSTTDVESLRELLNEGLQELVTVILSFVYIAAMLLWLDLGIGAVAVASFVPLYLLSRLYQRRAGRVFRDRSTAIASVIVKFVETMNGIRPVRAFRRETVNDADFQVLNRRHERTNGDALLEMARYVVGSRLVANTAVALMVLWGAWRVTGGSLELGVLAAAVLYLRRLYDPTAGRVLLDGVDLRDLAGPELRRGVVMVTQEAFLFSGTVAENIAIGRPEADRAEIERAAKAIGAHEFIAALPDGYDTDVRKRGGRISAGQRQLVAFARALLADPAVLILDEATSSLDVPGEQAVQAAMATVLKGRTAVVIAHRLSTVEIADRVLVMEHGRIVEDGSPAGLIAGTGRFADLHKAWRDSLV